MTILVATPTGTMLHVLEATTGLTLCGKRVCNICADSQAKKK